MEKEKTEKKREKEDAQTKKIRMAGIEHRTFRGKFCGDVFSKT